MFKGNVEYVKNIWTKVCLGLLLEISNISSFPFLNKFVFEYSIILASLVPSESTFSESGHLLRFSLDP